MKFSRYSDVHKNFIQWPNQNQRFLVQKLLTQNCLNIWRLPNLLNASYITTKLLRIFKNWPTNLIAVLVPKLLLNFVFIQFSLTAITVEMSKIKKSTQRNVKFTWIFWYKNISFARYKFLLLPGITNVTRIRLPAVL